MVGRGVRDGGAAPDRRCVDGWACGVCVNGCCIGSMPCVRNLGLSKRELVWFLIALHYLFSFL